MTVSPLFIKNRSTLLQSLRLKDTNESTTQQVDNAIAEVRTELYTALGGARISTIKTYTVTDTPTTTNELVRSEATLTEDKWIRLLLLRRMPSFFLGSSSGAEETWNTTGLLREDAARHESELTRLQSEVDCGLGKLQADTEECVTVQAAVIGPTKTNPAPGASIFA